MEPKSVDFIGYIDVFRQTEDGQPTHWLAMYFAVLVDPALVKNGEPEAIDEIGWFKLNEFPTPMHSQFDNFMKRYGDQLVMHMGLKKAPQNLIAF